MLPPKPTSSRLCRVRGRMLKLPGSHHVLDQEMLRTLREMSTRPSHAMEVDGASNCKVLYACPPLSPKLPKFKMSARIVRAALYFGALIIETRSTTFGFYSALQSNASGLRSKTLGSEVPLSRFRRLCKARE